MPQIILHELFKPLVDKLKNLKRMSGPSTTSDHLKLVDILIDTFSNDINSYWNNPCRDISFDEIRPKGKRISEWEGSFVFDCPIDFNYESTGDPKYNSYVNTKTGERFSVGDYVEVYDCIGTITKFVTSLNDVNVFTTIRDNAVYNLNILKKVLGKEVWLHKPSNQKYIIDKSTSIAYIGTNQITKTCYWIPDFVLNNSQDWIKL